jgi:hypothetical protein
MTDEDFNEPHLDPDYTDMSVSELINEIGVKKRMSNDLYAQYKDYKDEETTLKNVLGDKLHTLGLRSAKGLDYTASIAESPTLIIQDEAKVIAWIKDKLPGEADYYIGIKKTEFNSLAKTVAKEDKTIDGTELVVNQSLSIRKNSNSKEKAPF